MFFGLLSSLSKILKSGWRDTILCLSAADVLCLNTDLGVNFFNDEEMPLINIKPALFSPSLSQLSKQSVEMVVTGQPVEKRVKFEETECCTQLLNTGSDDLLGIQSGETR